MCLSRHVEIGIEEGAGDVTIRFGLVWFGDFSFSLAC